MQRLFEVYQFTIWFETRTPKVIWNWYTDKRTLKRSLSYMFIRLILSILKLRLDYILVKFVEDSLYKIWSDIASLSRPYHFNFFKGCITQVLLGPFLKTLTHISFLAPFYVHNLIKDERLRGCGFYTLTIVFDLNNFYKYQHTIWCYSFIQFSQWKKTNLKISYNIICVIIFCDKYCYLS